MPPPRVADHRTPTSHGGLRKHEWIGGPGVVTATRRSTTTGVVCTPGTFQAGGSTTCTATVTDTSPGMTSAPTGEVTWSSDAVGGFTSPCILMPTSTAESSCTVAYACTIAGEHT